MCHCDWLNKELNSQDQGRKRVCRTSGQSEVGGYESRRRRVARLHRGEQDVQDGREIKGHEAKCRLIEMVNLSYKC